MKESVLLKKSFDFSVSIYLFCTFLREDKFDYIIVNQLMKSGTAVCALVREAEFAQSRLDFINKLSVALKETNETIYWLELIEAVAKEDHAPKPTVQILLSEIKGMLIASIKTAKSNLKK
jgi:four helix bundle protein